MSPRTLRSTLICCASLLLAAGCSGEPRPESEPAPEPAVAPPATPAAAAPAPIAEQQAAAELEPTPDELPVLEDFEDEAEQQITIANYRAELDKLEKELDAKN